MASNPPFQVEDQTDEDFFDKLVEDDFRTTMSASQAAPTAISTDTSNSDDVRAFANLSIGDVSVDDYRMCEEKGISDSSAVDESALPASKADENSDPLFVESHPSGASNVLASEGNGVMALEGEGPGLKAEAVPVSNSIGATLATGSGGFGVKEVGWNSFFAISSDNFGHSESDFFSELENSAAHFSGNMENCANGGVDFAMGNTLSKDFGIDNPVNYGKFYESQLNGSPTDQTANGHHCSGNHYWENLYPGWKYDAATGQFYHVDNHEYGMDSQLSNGNLTTGWGDTSNGTTEAAYLRQSSQPVVRTIAEPSTMENISNWNQDYQVNGGYPEHMIFDPLYPGWYYDTVAQEWRILDIYNVPFQSTGQVHEHQNQNGYASIGAYSNDGANAMLGENGQTGERFPEDLGSQGQCLSFTNLTGGHNEQGSDAWNPNTVAKTETTPFSAKVSGFDGNQQVESFYGSTGSVDNLSTQQMSAAQPYEKASQAFFETNGMARAHNFVPNVNFSWHQSATNVKQSGQMVFSNNFFGNHQPRNVPQQSLEDTQQLPYALSSGRSPHGRPPHALVTFGFGGKLIVMKDNSHLHSSSFGTQTSGRSLISVLNLMEVVSGNDSSLSDGTGTSSYFGALCQQSFPGPLTGGSMGSKDLYKWIDERISSCESLGPDYRKAELLKLLLSLLKISCQHYGKLRSPFGSDTILRDPDTPESAVAKLFASAKNGREYSTYSALSQCLQRIPPEEQLRTTASEVQNLLVSGRKMEALQCAQEGQLWGPALIIAIQLGEQFYVDTVKQMAIRQLVAGAPLRTLCLLIAGQPAEVFSSNNMSNSGLAGSMIMSHQNEHGCNSVLENWEENLAVITANRTKDDELVITHLGDCLWKERSEIIAAHICYIIAELNFEPHSDAARLCLIGMDHWRFPRTYASPEAIQRTELYEYAKVLGNSQYILIPFQPYKIMYAYMLAEVGKLSDALKYCQVVLKSLKTGRAPEVDAWKQLVVSLEERIRIHQQGGYTNLAPAKLVGKLLNFFDSTAHRVVGGLPPTAPTTQGHVQANGQHHHQFTPRVSTSQSTMAMSSLVPSASMEPISAWAGDGNKVTMHNRSVSEPDFGRTKRQDHQISSSIKETSSEAQGKELGTSRFGRFGFGSQLLQKTVGLVLRPKASRQAKLGETNKFYYDEKLKRWVEEGAEPPGEETALPPPPTTAAFQNTVSDRAGAKPRSTSEMSPAFTPTTPDDSSAMPPIPSTSNQFSARGRMGVRARYVDTFNPGSTNAGSSFKLRAAPSVRPPLSANAKFFIPTVPVQTDERSAASSTEENPAEPENHATSSAPTIQRFPSMDHVIRRSTTPPSPYAHLSGHSRRTMSWGGSFDVRSKSEAKALSEVLGMPSSESSNGFGDELHEVEF